MLEAKLDEMREEESGEDGLLVNALNEKGDSIPKDKLKKAIKEAEDVSDEHKALLAYQKKLSEKDKSDKAIKEAQKKLDELVLAKYGELTVDEIKHLLFDKKWMVRLENDITDAIDQVLNALASRVVLIAKRYECTLSEIEEKTADSKAKVMSALERMGYKW